MPAANNRACILSSSDSRCFTTVKSYVIDLPAYLWLKSTLTLPDPMDIITHFLLSTSVSSPTPRLSASLPSFRAVITLTWLRCRSPYASAGGTTTVCCTPTSASTRTRLRPDRTGYDVSFTDTNCGLGVAIPVAALASGATSPLTPITVPSAVFAVYSTIMRLPVSNVNENRPSPVQY